ncbi:MAG: choice-of-anchor tandem repeat GloVer-containing protein [Candidatus Cybelea sp.]
MNVNGTLYGTTAEGGAKHDGTVFAITASGKETVLHSFAFGKGAAPSASLLNVTDTLYGTTYLGGKGAGTVFSLSP